MNRGLEPKSRAAAVILDFDGVVADSLAAHLSAWDHAVRRLFGRSLDDPASIVAYATPTIASILARRYGDPSLASDLARIKADALMTGEIPVPLFAGAKEFLAALAEQGIPHGIASNSSNRFIQAILDRAGVAVATVVGRTDAMRTKPHPDVFWECSNRLKIEPGERGRVLVFEDSLHGLKAAIAAGMIAVGVTTSHSDAEMRAGGARLVCEGLADAHARGLYSII